MSRGWMLVLLSLSCAGHSRCVLDYAPFIDNSDSQSEHFEKRYGDIDYDSFIGLMGRRSTGTNHATNAQFRRRRNAVSAIPAWRGQRRVNFFLKDRRQRFCCAV
ncbi:tachykinin-3b isoform X2 [Myxocyprinus asiaticus]|uniref:tachykinin-3b isoform X2 n=1 Tax=Myxocyprinus asiaticus TaxID=70543 RepID=UPI0022237921|nr:tachykinin-3b isoform X2 [Myxocyprinus asiaticus]